jgi:hypothetical protein
MFCSPNDQKEKIMKKLILILLVISMFTFVPSTPQPVAASPGGTDEADFTDLTYFGLGEAPEFGCPRGTYRVRRHTRTKKKLLNAAVAGGIGAAIGGGIGGKRGALIGVGSGAGGYLVYRYVRDRRGRCVRRYSRA